MNLQATLARIFDFLMILSLFICKKKFNHSIFFSWNPPYLIIGICLYLFSFPGWVHKKKCEKSTDRKLSTLDICSCDDMTCSSLVLLTCPTSASIAQFLERWPGLHNVPGAITCLADFSRTLPQIKIIASTFSIILIIFKSKDCFDICIHWQISLKH